MTAIRIPADKLTIIDHNATAAGMSRTQWMIEAACNWEQPANELDDIKARLEQLEANRRDLMRDTWSNDVETAAKLAREDAEPDHVDPADYADHESALEDLAYACDLLSSSYYGGATAEAIDRSIARIECELERLRAAQGGPKDSTTP